MDRNYLIKKWLHNELSPREKQAFEALEDSAFLQEIIQESKRFKRQTTNQVESFESLYKRLPTKKESTRSSWILTLSKIAAIFVIGLGVYFYMNNEKIMTYTTQLAQKEVIHLPDNSSVTLHENSSLEYNKNTWDYHKKIQLKGQAFFDVAKGKRFDVETPHGTITVLGTEFNVVSRGTVFHVVCFEGLVQVRYKDTLIKLPVGKAFKAVDGKTATFQVVTSQPEWLQNMSVFEDVKIIDVLKNLEKQYKVTIKYDSIDQNILFTGAFEHENLEKALKAVTKSLQMTYEIKENNLVLIKNAKK